MKSALIFSLALLTPTAAFAAGAPTLIKSSTSPAVYLLQDGIRHPFPLQSVYEGWYGKTFENVLGVPGDTLATYPLGKNVKFKPGTLIKIQTDPKVYLVKDEAGNLQWIQTEQDFLARGLKFSDVHDVPDTFFPDYTPQPDSYFATPVQGTTPAPITPPVVVPAQSYTIQSVQSSATKDDSSHSTITYTVSGNTSAPLTFSYQKLGSATTTRSFTADTTFTGTISAGIAEVVPYHIEFGPAGATTQKDGFLTAYSDFTVSPSTFAPVNQSIFQPIVRLGSFKVTNNSSAARTLSSASFIFDASTLASDDPTKTIELREIDSQGAVIKPFGELMIAAGTSILGPGHTQVLRIDESIAPGETKTFEVVGRYFDSVNKDRFVPTDTMTVRFDQLTTLGDAVTLSTDHVIGTLVYKPAN